MEWWLVLGVIFLALLVVLLAGVPVAFGFLGATFAAMYWVMGPRAPQLLINSIFDSLTQFTLTPVPFFVLMGGLIFRSGLMGRTLEVIEDHLGNVPGRLAVVTLLAGALFASLSGSALANTATLGAMLVPEMRSLGYDKRLIVGPVMAAGAVAMLIPPSTLTVIYGSLAKVSVGQLLLAGVGPGLLLVGLYVLYVLVVCWRRPSLAPAWGVHLPPRGQRVRRLLGVLVPVCLIIFLTLGSIWVGWATPTEAAALGAAGALALALASGRLTLRVLGEALLDAARVTGMILIIVAGSMGFSQVLAFSGATRELVRWVVELPVPGWVVMAGMLAVVLFLGLFMEEVAIMMITIPIFTPIASALGFHPVWFGILMLIALEISLLTPPVGLVLYVAKSVVPEEFTMRDIWAGAVPYVVLGLVGMVLVALFPGIALSLVPLPGAR